MTILGIDTTGTISSIALRRNGETIAESSRHSTDGLAHVIFPQLEDLLYSAECSLAEIDCFAAANGPGSFTGVRVGLTAVKGLAEALGKPVAAISNLRALATFGGGDRRVVLLDARRNEVYAAVYDGTLHAILPETVTNFLVWIQRLENVIYEFIAPSGTSFRDEIAGSKFSKMRWIESPPSIAAAIALTAEIDSMNGALTSPLEADANYVRSSDAELAWRDR
jgi:tRNA threonylcarbamoyladenosine biosynthesis protein TsaB